MKGPASRSLADHAAPHAVEQIGGTALVDVTEQAAINSVATELAKSRGKDARDFEGNAQLLVFLLPNEARAVVHGDADAPRIRRVRATAVPDAPVEHEHA